MSEENIMNGTDHLLPPSVDVPSTRIVEPIMDKSKLEGEPTQEIPIVGPDTYGEEPPKDLDVDTVNESGLQDRTSNMRKAERQAHVYKDTIEGFESQLDETNGSVMNNGNIQRMATIASESEGVRYEIEELAKRCGMSVENVNKIMRGDLESSLQYGRDIIEHQLSFGERLTPNQSVFLLISELSRIFVNGMRPIGEDLLGPDIFDVDKKGRTIRISGRDADRFPDYSTLQVTITSKSDNEEATEIWTASPFKMMPDGFHPRFSGEYVLKERKLTDKGRFKEIETISRKRVDELDADSLKVIVDEIKDM
jgi:hypothetical protein